MQKDLEEYVRENYRAEENEGTHEAQETAEAELSPVSKSAKDLTNARRVDLDALMDNVGESFHSKLFRLIDERGLSDVEVYKRVGMDRKLFSKIRSNPSYHPRRSTVLGLAIALHLNLEETHELLASAGYALSSANRGDLILQYYISHGEFDLEKINNALAAYGQPILQ